MKNLPEPLSATLPELPEGWYPLSYAALADTQLAIIGTDVDLHAAWKKDREQIIAGTPGRLAVSAEAKIWVFDGNNLWEAISFPLLEPFPLIDQFPDGRWLVANARSRGHGNARILQANGDEERRIELGDGIEHVKIDRSSRIWVGWFDEGVFGNDNWSYPGHKWPPSANGLAAFDAQGTLLQTSTKTSIADCYALNVFNDEAWACTYTDFPISQIKNDREHLWSTELSGVKAIAVSQPLVIAAGGYSGEANAIKLLRLEKDKTRLLAEWETQKFSGTANDLHLIDGRGGTLHIVTGREWHRWYVSQFLAEFRN